MRIIYLAPSIIPSRAANSVHVFKMVHAFSALGHSASLVVPDDKKGREKGVSDVFEYYGVTPFSYRYFPWYRFSGSKYIYSLLMALWLWFQKKDLVYSRDFYPAVFAALLGTPVVMEFHAPPKRAQGIKGKLVERFYRSGRLQALVVISEALKKIFIEQGFHEDRIIVAHDGSDPMPKGEVFPLEGSVKAGYVGHLYKGRGIENIIYLAQHNPAVHFHIAGGLEGDIAFWREQTSGLKNLHFHGFIAPSQTDAFRCSCDVLLAPYQQDLTLWGGGVNTSSYMSPLKIFEYMAAGKPVVCSDLPVLREVLNEELALLVQPDNMKAWDEALKKLTNDPSLRTRLGQVAQAEFLKKYTWKQRAKYILDQLEFKQVAG